MNENLKEKRPTPEEVPDWATHVVSRTERHSIGITYIVMLENEDAVADNDLGTQRSLWVWSKEVFFGDSDSHRAGGSAFREASHEQEAVSERYAAKLKKG